MCCESVRRSFPANLICTAILVSIFSLVGTRKKEVDFFESMEK